MRIYCNSNVFGRPFDDLSQERVFNEAIASVKISSLSKLDFVSIATSEVLLTEVSLIEDESKKELVESLIISVYKEIGPIKTVKFFQLIGVSRGDTLKEIEGKTSQMSKKEALDLIKKAGTKRKDLWKDVGLV